MPQEPADDAYTDPAATPTRADGDGASADGTANAASDRPLLQAVSGEMVRLFKEQFGRGPTRARTEWAGPDTLITILEDTFTPAERNLVEMGEHERLRETRMFFQYATVREFCEPVERITGRKVRAFISGLDTEVNGLATEIFILHPPGSSEPSRIEAGNN